MKRFWALYGFMTLLFLSLALVFGFAGQIAAAPGETAPREQVQFADGAGPLSPQTVFEQVNVARQANGLVTLAADQKLADLAAARAADLAARQYYAHRDPDGKYYFDYFKDYKITSGYSCENLDLVFVPEEDRVVAEWLASLKGHRGCLLSPDVSHAGYAAAKLTLVSFDGKESTAYVVVAIHTALHK